MPKNSLLRSTVDFLFGFDFFVSYAHADGDHYPARLASRLKQAGFRTFLDAQVYVAGDDLNEATRRRVRMSKYLVVVARPAALTSIWVWKEVEQSVIARRKAIVIDINRTFEKADADNALKRLFKDYIRINERIDNLNADPTDGVFEKLRDSFKATRRESVRRRVVSATAIILLAISIVAIWMFRRSESARYRNLLDQTQFAVASLAKSREILVPRAIGDLKHLRRQMVLEELRAQFANATQSQKLALAYGLAEFGDVKVAFIVEKIRTAKKREVPNIVTALSHSSVETLELLRSVSQDQKDWQYKSRLAVLALSLGDESIAKEMSQPRSNPIQSTAFINTLSKWRGDDVDLAKRIRGIDDAPFRYCIAVALGSTPFDQIDTDAKQAWQPILAHWCQSQRDAGNYSAARWALRRWNLHVPDVEPSTPAFDRRNWHVSNTGIRMLKIPAGSFTREAKGVVQKVTLSRPFWLAGLEISVELFRRFLEDPNYPSAEKPEDWNWWHIVNRFSPTPGHPISSVNWHDAVLFCKLEC